ncbi:MAG: hypothetical protein K9J27_06250 [Bacteroidales bacterium]|nr:hypothetical protein [Bacteroidales bacterium]MCF8333257.1 hypothetical protein [Bacteroidales bacterium]
MKKLPFLFIALLFGTVYCGPKTIKVIESSFKNGQPQVVTFYEKINGEKQKKKQIQYYQTGQKKMEGPYKNGKRHGQWISYYKNGRVWTKIHYIEGKANGIKKVYYENGELHYKGELKNGERTGKWTFYDVNGKASIINYNNRR